jgi:phage tail sheath protein FI
MPEYLAPGVYVEETSFRSKSIEGVSTTTTGFVGPARYGPLDLEPDVLTSLVEFERIYGDGQELEFADGTRAPNFIWHAARAFFAEGGKRLYVSRVFEPAPATGGGRGTWPPGGGTDGLTIQARFPGAVGNFAIEVTLRARPNVLGQLTDPPGSGNRIPTVTGLSDRDVVWIRDVDPGSPPFSPPPQSAGAEGDFFLALQNPATGAWRFRRLVVSGSPPVASIPATELDIADLVADAEPGRGASVRPLSLTLRVLSVVGGLAPSGTGEEEIGTWGDIALDPQHRTAGLADSLGAVFASEPETLGLARSLPIVVTAGTAVTTGLDTLLALFGPNPESLLVPSAAQAARGITRDQILTQGVTRRLRLAGGDDGVRPGALFYEGRVDPATDARTGLKQLEDTDVISIVAAPGATWRYAGEYRDDANEIMNQLIGHAERMRYRIAVLDSAEGQSIADVRNMRSKMDSKYAALYFPWVRVLDPITRKEINLPPSGFVTGIYARNDINRAVYKAPANEVVTLAIGFETLVNKGQQDVLNPLGVNCFRFFEGRGFRLWGARTISSDPEWKYVNLRRYFAYLEHSVDKGTQWAVFEPNGPLLWDNVRRTIEDFLLNEWMMGALLGEKPDRAFFVRCDRSTMSQNDLDNGRLVCLIGVAALRPAEFVIFRIGQWTAERRAA